MEPFEIEACVEPLTRLLGMRQRLLEKNVFLTELLQVTAWINSRREIDAAIKRGLLPTALNHTREVILQGMAFLSDCGMFYAHRYAIKCDTLGEPEEEPERAEATEQEEQP